MPENITSELLDKYYQDLTTKNIMVSENERYYMGKNPGIIDKKQEKAPDNRIPIPLAKIAVEDMAGYAGRPGDVTTTFELMSEINDKKEDDQEDEYQKFVEKVFDFNNNDIEQSELYEECLVQGISYELWWTNTKENVDGIFMPEFAILNSYECFPIWKRSLKPELEYFIRFYKVDDDRYAEIYYPKKMNCYIKPKNKDSWVRNEYKDSEYPYERVPINWYPANRHRKSLFQAEKGIIDAHDILISKSQNEVDRFNALVALFPGPIDKQFVDKLKELSAVGDLFEYEHWPEYLQKDYSGVSEFYKDLMDRLERLYHKSIKVPDMTNQTFGGTDESGVARAFKLLGMEFKASQIEMYFRQGLYRRFDLINDVIRFANKPIADKLDDYTINVQFKRNLPVDEKSKVEIATMLVGVVSDETLLKILPKSIIENAKKELELKKKENRENGRGILDDNSNQGQNQVEQQDQ